MSEPTEQSTRSAYALVAGCDDPLIRDFALKDIATIIDQRDTARRLLKHARTYVEMAHRERGNDDTRADLDAIDTTLEEVQ